MFCKAYKDMRGLVVVANSCQQVLLRLFGTLLVVLLGPSLVEDASAQYTTSAIQSGFMLKFPRYVEWPEPKNDATKPLSLCLLGAVSWREELERVARFSKVERRSIEIRKIRILDDIKNCHMLFIPSSETSYLREIVEVCQKNGVLSVSDADNALVNGVIISFFIKDGKVNFSINNDSAKKSGLVISFRLLTMAKEEGS